MAKFDLISLIPQKIPLFINERYYLLFESLIKDILFAVPQPAQAKKQEKKEKLPFFVKTNSSKQYISFWGEIKKSINKTSTHPSGCPEIVYKYLFLRAKKTIEKIKSMLLKMTICYQIELVLRLYLYLSKKEILKVHENAKVSISNEEKEMIAKINENSEKMEDLYKTKCKVTHYFLSKAVDENIVIHKFDKYHAMYVNKYEESNLGSNLFLKPKIVLPSLTARKTNRFSDNGLTIEKPHLGSFPVFLMSNKSSRKYSSDQVKLVPVTINRNLSSRNYKCKTFHRTVSTTNFGEAVTKLVHNKKRTNSIHYLSKKDFYY
jgi:hypothetical protein